MNWVANPPVLCEKVLTATRGKVGHPSIMGTIYCEIKLR